MTWKPPIAFPTQSGPDVGTPTMWAPPAMQISVEAGPGWTAGTDVMELAAEAVVNYYAADLSHFVSSERQQAALGGLPVIRKHRSVPGLDIDYRQEHGRETIGLRIKPQNAPAGAMKLDLNYDGYIVWVFDVLDGPPLTGPSAPPAFNIVLNGYNVIENFVPAAEGATTVVVMFGKTALRCQSLHDKVNPLALPGNPGLAPKVVPGRAKITGPFSNLNAPTTKYSGDSFGYFLFGPNDDTGWLDPLNPQSAYDTPGEWEPLSTIVGIQFADPKHSPLVNKGVNTLSVQFSDPTTSYSSEVGLVTTLEVEFYDRAKVRAVAGSWNYSPTSGQVVLINDLPLLWSDQTPYDYEAPTMAMVFDLTPSTSRPTAAETAGWTGGTLTPEQLAPVLAALTASTDAAAATLLIPIETLSADDTALNTAYINASGADAFTALFATDTTVDAIVAQPGNQALLQDEMDNAVVNILARIAPGPIATALIDAWDTQQVDYASYVTAYGTYSAAVTAAQAVYAAAVRRLMSQPPSGNSINGFSYRTVDGSETGDWVFGAYSSP